jgi:hypothetical protein
MILTIYIINFLLFYSSSLDDSSLLLNAKSLEIKHLSVRSVSTVLHPFCQVKVKLESRTKPTSLNDLLCIGFSIKNLT